MQLEDSGGELPWQHAVDTAGPGKGSIDGYLAGDSHELLLSLAQCVRSPNTSARNGVSMQRH